MINYLLIAGLSVALYTTSVHYNELLQKVQQLETKCGSQLTRNT